MNAQRPQPRRSALSGLHPAIPRSEQTDPKPEIPAITPSTAAPMRTAPPPSSAPEPVSAPAPAPSRNQKMTINIPGELVDQAKDAFWLDHRDYRSFSAWVSEALRQQIAQTMARHGVDSLPARPTTDLPAGRPLS
ncbi:MAG: hypothetical protein JWO67_1317 [Streptosporangiaceae bacterium]|nr:hypothetical protein [Streptosporangiaceae bacterium]